MLTETFPDTVNGGTGIGIHRPGNTHYGLVRFPVAVPRDAHHAEQDLAKLPDIDAEGLVGGRVARRRINRRGPRRAAEPVSRDLIFDSRPPGNVQGRYPSR